MNWGFEMSARYWPTCNYRSYQNLVIYFRNGLFVLMSFLDCFEVFSCFLKLAQPWSDQQYQQNLLGVLYYFLQYNKKAQILIFSFMNDRYFKLPGGLLPTYEYLFLSKPFYHIPIHNIRPRTETKLYVIEFAFCFAPV